MHFPHTTEIPSFIWIRPTKVTKVSHSGKITSERDFPLIIHVHNVTLAVSRAFALAYRRRRRCAGGT